ncbi:hypothetical protein IWQ60_007492 [Tieghemiomyces parasiticus]|uniref:RING-type domain-containing protein n=1 Tax=Tieghemiomyces parasiticus TaxID=78921 RepID=A0A9W8A2Z3_9FUNG|nr:hypothetical protein IWQ60_007492 [Tieghemiomyces parasiticus]
MLKLVKSLVGLLVLSTFCRAQQITLSDDVVTLDHQTFQVKQNSSTTEIAKNYNINKSLLTLNSKPFYGGLLYIYNDTTLPALINDVDHILLFPAPNVTYTNAALAAINNPRVIACLMYLTTPNEDIILYTSTPPVRHPPVFPISSEIGLQLQSQLTLANQDPGTVTADGPIQDYQRIYSRINYFTQLKVEKSSGGVNLGVVLGCTAAGVVVLLLLIGFCVLRRYRQTRPRHAASHRDGSHDLPKDQAVRSLLAREVKSTRAPALTSAQLHKVPVIQMSKSNFPMFPLASRQAVERFIDMSYTFTTSSDEGSDGEDDIAVPFQPTGKPAHRGRVRRNHDLDAEDPLDAAKTPTNNHMHPDPLQARLNEEAFELQSSDGWPSVTDDDTGGNPGEQPPLPISAHMMNRGNKDEWIQGPPPRSAPLRGEGRKPSPIIVPGVSAHLARKSPGFAVSPGTPGTAVGSPSKPFKQSAAKLRQKYLQQSMNGPPYCGVCRNEFRPGDSARRLPCYHIFHCECVDQWLIRKTARCPLCKANSTPRRILDESNVV